MCFSFCRETDSVSDIGSDPESGAPESGAPESGAPECGAPESGAPESGAPDNGADYGADTESEPATVDDKELVVTLCCC